MMQITEQEFQNLSEFIQSQFGIILNSEKKLLLTGRLHKLVDQLGFSSYTEYYHYLLNDGTGEANRVLSDKISTNTTHFLREPDHFDYFRDHVLPCLKYTKETTGNRDFRIWCAASSTREEPYSLAMIMADYFGIDSSKWDTRILATDISQSVLDIAIKGIYPEERLRPLPQSWQLKYFKLYEKDDYEIVNTIKKDVAFQRINLMDKYFPFKKKFDVIFCRNVMIYFDQPTKYELMNRLCDYLEPGGYLFVGHSEALIKKIPGLEYIQQALYRYLPLID